MDMRVKNILGKTVIDLAGDELGKVYDLEIDWNTKTIQNIIDWKVKKRKDFMKIQ